MFIFKKSLILRVLLSSLLASVLILMPAWFWAKSTLNQTMLDLELADKHRLFTQWCRDFGNQATRLEDSALRMAENLKISLRNSEPLSLEQAEVIWEDFGDGSLRTRRSPSVRVTDAQVIVSRQAERTPKALGWLKASSEFLGIYGLGAMSGAAENSWFVPGHGGLTIYWPGLSDFIYKASPNLSYEGTDWLDLARPENNPDHKTDWTRLLWEPDAGMWVISVICPVILDGYFAGVVGHDISLEIFLRDFRQWFDLQEIQLMLFNSEGDALLVEHPGMPSEAASMVLNYAGLKDFDVRDAMEPVLKNEKPSSMILSADGKYLIAHRIPTTGWVAVLRFSPPGEGIYTARAARQLMGGVGIFVFVLSILILLAVMRDHYMQVREKQTVSMALSKAEKASRSKTLFLANLSHEIRSPLGALIGAVGLLRRPLETKDRERTLELMEYSCEALRSVIDDVLEVSRVENGRVEIENHPFRWHELLKKTVSMFDDRAREQKVELVFQIPETGDSQLFGDEGRIRQILINLVTNAIKFAKQGRVEVGGDFQPEKGLHLWVKDNGIGIEEERLNDIFEPFVQSSSEIRREFGGTGLGLAISYELARAMQGRLWAESTIGKGSTFHFEVSLKPYETEKDSLASKALAGMPRSIMLVGEDSVSREILSWQLRAEDFEVQESDSLDSLRGVYGFQCLILELLSLDETALENIRSLKRARPELVLLLLLSQKECLEEQSLQKTGVDGILIRPARIGDMIRELARISAMRMRS